MQSVFQYIFSGVEVRAQCKETQLKHYQTIELHKRIEALCTDALSCRNRFESLSYTDIPVAFNFVASVCRSTTYECEGQMVYRDHTMLLNIYKLLTGMSESYQEYIQALYSVYLTLVPCTF